MEVDLPPLRGPSYVSCKLKITMVTEALRSRTKKVVSSQSTDIEKGGPKEKPSPPAQSTSDPEDGFFSTCPAPSRRKTTLKAERKGSIRLWSAGARR